MRVNVYEEEIEGDVQFVTKKAETEAVYRGVRFYLKSHPHLHDERGIPAGDDDRSAVTFFGTPKQLRDIFTRALDCLPPSLDSK